MGFFPFYRGREAFWVDVGLNSNPPTTPSLFHQRRSGKHYRHEGAAVTCIMKPMLITVLAGSSFSSMCHPLRVRTHASVCRKHFQNHCIPPKGLSEICKHTPSLTLRTGKGDQRAISTDVHGTDTRVSEQTTWGLSEMSCARCVSPAATRAGRPPTAGCLKDSVESQDAE